MRVDLAAIAPARRGDNDARLANAGAPSHLRRHSTEHSDATGNPIERRPPTRAVKRRPDDLGSHRAVVVGERLVGRPPIGQDGLPRNAFREDAQPVAGRTIRTAGEAGAKGVPVVGKSGRRLGEAIQRFSAKYRGHRGRTKLGTFTPFPQIEPPSAWLTAVASEMD